MQPGLSFNLSLTDSIHVSALAFLHEAEALLEELLETLSCFQAALARAASNHSLRSASSVGARCEPQKNQTLSDDFRGFAWSKSCVPS